MPIDKVRKEVGLTQTELADTLDKPQSYVSKYESGERKLDYLEVVDILEACSTTVVKFDNQLKRLIGG
jgi:predicted transcriptional regulator